jgi:hypothetical protein
MALVLNEELGRKQQDVTFNNFRALAHGLSEEIKKTSGAFKFLSPPPVNNTSSVLRKYAV